MGLPIPDLLLFVWLIGQRQKSRAVPLLRNLLMTPIRPFTTWLGPFYLMLLVVRLAFNN